MWDLTVSVPDHCLSFYFSLPTLNFNLKNLGIPKQIPVNVAIPKQIPRLYFATNNDSMLLTKNKQPNC